MNWKRFFIAFVAAWVFVFVFDFTFHGKIMHNLYLQTPGLWRAEMESKNYMLLLLLGQAAFVFFFTLIFARGFGSGGGAGGGFRYGVLIGLLYVATDLIQYAVQPLTSTIFFARTIAEIVEAAIAGTIVGALYKS